ncbi:transcription termination factor Rho [Anaeromicropila herbilytica]|uniref:Transcription termination factor Rho n=1 Tax=Anaeromicropila herbilytica TaxID=2785025 RepID=A0A7R7EJ67_9FIRM|nr:transcription termination factor Rho [Anaeromicropila herbilytica]BCN29690.1 transcription termination factor Rho [Anaeromicropila herbilytica]
MSNQYENMSLAELKELAKANGIKNISTLRKHELIDILNNFEDLNNTADKEHMNSDRKENMDIKDNEKVETAKSDDKSSLDNVRTDNIKTDNTKTDNTKTDNTRVDNSKLDNTKNESKKTNYIPTDMDQLDSGETKEGILEVLPDGYGFIRCDNFLPGENDVYVSPAQIRRFNLKTGDIVAGNTRIRNQNEKFSALLYVKQVNGFHPAEAARRKKFEDLTPIFPNDRIHLETPGASVAMRMVDLISPIGKGQRGMIVSQPKTGKTTLLKQVAKAITKNHPDMSLIILLIDERPEEVTDIKESIEGKNVEVIYSTFDELPENHKRVSEMVIERAKRLVEHKKDVVILLDSITRLARAYNLTVQASGRTLSGGLDPAALHMPKKFFGAARNMREGGSLTILATALVDTGSRMDDVVFEEFKGTGNMELVLDRSLSEKRIFPAIDLAKSSTRRDDLLLTSSEIEASYLMHKALGGLKSDEALEKIIELFMRTKTNAEFIETIKKTKIVN